MLKKYKFKFLSFVMIFNLVVATLAISGFNTSNKASAATSNQLKLNEVAPLYDNPNQVEINSGSALAPQTVNVKKTWHLINTWLGPKYISFNGLSSTSSKIKLTAKTPLYDSTTSTTSYAALQPQTVTVIESWYLVQTWLGDKYVVLTPPDTTDTVVEDVTFKADGTVVLASGLALNPAKESPQSDVELAGAKTWTVKKVIAMLVKYKAKMNKVVGKFIDKIPFVSKKTKESWKKKTSVDALKDAVALVDTFTGTINQCLVFIFVKVGLPLGVSHQLANLVEFIFF